MNGPFQIGLGTGRVAIGKFDDKDGSHGIVLIDTGVENPNRIGEWIPHFRDENHKPQSNECYIRCANRASALVLLEQVARVVAAFTPGTL